jgi:hypothetical protein
LNKVISVRHQPINIYLLHLYYSIYHKRQNGDDLYVEKEKMIFFFSLILKRFKQKESSCKFSCPSGRKCRFKKCSFFIRPLLIIRMNVFRMYGIG